MENSLSQPNHPTLFALPEHKNFPRSYIDVTDFRSVRREQFPLGSRVASVTQEAHHELLERFLKAQGRPWGYGPGEAVERLGRNEIAKYRCARCNLYDVDVPVISASEVFPLCENCKKIGKAAQWYPLTKHKKGR